MRIVVAFVRNFSAIISQHIMPGTIYYVSDGLETLCYRAREHFVIIVMGGSEWLIARKRHGELTCLT